MLFFSSSKCPRTAYSKHNGNVMVNVATSDAMNFSFLSINVLSLYPEIGSLLSFEKYSEKNVKLPSTVRRLSKPKAS